MNMMIYKVWFDRWEGGKFIGEGKTKFYFNKSSAEKDFFNRDNDFFRNGIYFECHFEEYDTED